MIPYGKHSIDQAEIKAVSELLSSGWLTQGHKVPKFEEKLSDICHVKYACATSSATSALHIAYLTLGIDSSSLVWTTANTFVATANAARMCGAQLDFVDIDESTGNISLELLEQKLRTEKKRGVVPDVVTVVHFAGHPIDMKRISGLALEFGFKVIEDASHALGAIGHSGEIVGSCTYSDICVFSFHPVKIIATGEGGMLCTNDWKISESANQLRNHGIDKTLHNRGDSWEYDQVCLGYNYRMSDIHASIGIEQLNKLDSFLFKRRMIANRYDEQLKSSNIDCTHPDPSSTSSYHLYPILLAKGTNSTDKKAVFDELRKQGIGVNVHYKPVYLHSYYATYGFSNGYCPNAEDFYNREISIPIYPELSSELQDRVLESLSNALEVCA